MRVAYLACADEEQSGGDAAVHGAGVVPGREVHREDRHLLARHDDLGDVGERAAMCERGCPGAGRSGAT